MHRTDAADQWERKSVTSYKQVFNTNQTWIFLYCELGHTTQAFKRWLVRDCVCVFSEQMCASVSVSECLDVLMSRWMLFACSINRHIPVFYPSCAATWVKKAAELQRWSVRTLIWILHPKSPVVWFVCCSVLVQSSHLAKCSDEFAVLLD